ncbi:hypothetical protein BT63DRAFT_277873 [Microthyrium microscopicum]|uniref:ferric-chelate reductase (NADPH) n=1 Tax=Microthyrium microscopicum TaxID=703497 RepID=A0A6A6UA36_9PEZI|nr:hypothetical protein BT63DRAFT_277873 [Microthyrium microscopicum]
MGLPRSAAWLLSTLLLLQQTLVEAQNATRAGNSTIAAGNSTKSAAGSAKTSKAPKKAVVVPANTLENWRLVRAIVYTWVAMVVCLAIYVLCVQINRYIRTAACLNNETQRYFNEPPWLYGSLKKHLIDAPLFRTRHHREFRLSRAIDMGTLPSRAQLLFLVLYIGMTVLLTTFHIDYSAPRAKVQVYLMKRTGLLAILNMLPLFLLAGRNNPLIYWTGITFDTYNLIHRWLGRITVGEMVTHAIIYIIKKHDAGGFPAFGKAIRTSTFNQSGLVAASAATLIFILAASPVRHAFYETFLTIHILLAVTVLAGTWMHMDGYVRQRMLLKGIIAIWCIERGFRMIRIIYHNTGNGGTTAEITALPGDAVRIKMRLARPWTFSPGQHAYIYLPRVGWWQSHPFSVAWSDEDEEDTMSDKDSLPSTKLDIIERRHDNIYFVIRRRTGFTEKLWHKAVAAPGGVFTTKAYAEGPYNEQKLHSYGTVLLFAAGIGITHQVPHVRDLVRGYSQGTCAARKVVLVWVIQSPEHLEWIREWMTTILSLPGRREVLKIMLFVTRPKNTKEIYSPSSSVQMFPGKPNWQAIVDQEVAQAIGAIGVSVCGGGAVSDDIRRACRSWMGKVNIDFEEESFSW